MNTLSYYVNEGRSLKQTSCWRSRPGFSVTLELVKWILIHSQRVPRSGRYYFRTGKLRKGSSVTRREELLSWIAHYVAPYGSVAWPHERSVCLATPAGCGSRSWRTLTSQGASHASRDLLADIPFILTWNVVPSCKVKQVLLGTAMLCLQFGR